MDAETVSVSAWFDNAGGYRPKHNLDVLRRGIAGGLLNEQDKYGMTALSLAVMSGWPDGVRALLDAGADTELRYFRTGETALRMTLYRPNEAVIAALVAAGANPDAGNHWGLTPRKWAEVSGSVKLFECVPPGVVQMPVPLIQNAEHLADHYHPRFKISDREERETLQVGQAVDLYVYGPKSVTKQDTVKVRITLAGGQKPLVRYTAALETPVEQTHLPVETTEVTFGPESVASVYVPRPAKKRRTKK